MKILYSIGLILFISFSYVQHNDHDWYLWIPIYIASGVCPFFKFRRKAAWGIIGVSAIWALVIGPGLDWSLGDEIFREVGGLIIVVAWAVLVLCTSKAINN